MRYYILIMIAVLSSTFGFAQEDKKIDTTAFKIGQNTVLFINDVPDEMDYDYDLNNGDSLCKSGKESPVRLYVDFGSNGYMTSSEETAMPKEYRNMELDYARSLTFGFAIMSRGVDLIKDRLYVAPGIGLTWNRYQFKNNIQVVDNADTTMFVTDTVIQNDKYQLRGTYLEIPLVLGTRIGKGKYPLGIQMGVIGGFKFNSLIHQKFRFDGAKRKVKTRGGFNTNAFKFDVIARITYGDVGIFGRCALTPLFEDGKALEVYPFAAGITIGGFK